MREDGRGCGHVDAGPVGALFGYWDCCATSGGVRGDMWEAGRCRKGWEGGCRLVRGGVQGDEALDVVIGRNLNGGGAQCTGNARLEQRSG